jgi:CRP/FNR family cyclic AMP-dependent transcriptional regulator
VPNNEPTISGPARGADDFAAFELAANVQKRAAMKNMFLSKRREVQRFSEGQRVFSQGDRAQDVMYVQQGGVKLTVVSESGKEAVVSILGPGNLLGEGCLAGFTICATTATTLAPTVLLVMEKSEMIRLLHADRHFSDRFIAYLLAQKARVEEDLAVQLLNSSEKRLAHILLRLSHGDTADNSHKILPDVSQEVLAEMVGTTRSRVNFFMNKFRKLGFIEYGSGMSVPHVNKSLQSIVQRN